jgi:hypothetical protein
MGYQLREGLSFGVVAGRAVFLDIEEDRYFCLPPDLNEAFLSAAKQSSEPAEADITSLLSSDLLEQTSSRTAIEPAYCPRPRRSLIRFPTKLSLGAVLPGIFLDQYRAAWALRARPLAALVPPREVLRNRISDTGLSQLREIAHPFEAASRIYSAKDRCLTRSLALRTRLDREGIACNIVFGVQLMPFRAHCWLQAADLAVNDHHDHIAQFTPVCVR